MAKLTDIQHDILQHVATFQKKEGRSPTGTEVQQHFGYTHHSTARQHLQALERKGFIELARGGHGVPYHIRLLPPAFSIVDTLRVPILGSIAAGTPEEAIAETDTWAERLDDVLEVQPGDFLLRVKGESMIGEGIFPDDLVLIRPQPQVARGEIAAVRVADEEATLKRVFIEPPNVRLAPSNPTMNDMIYDAREVSIMGRFEGLIRSSSRHTRR
jgi:repressor LexA